MSTDHGSPEAVFAHAQTALAAGDLAAAFACFDRPDLIRIADNSVRALSTADPEFDELCERFGFDTIGELHELTESMAASAARSSIDPASFDPAAHRLLVKDHQAAITRGLGRVDDVPGFTAAMEGRMHSVMGGGSISSSLFDGETLTDVAVAGKKAWATRVERGRDHDDIGFVLKRDGWKIRLFARRPAG